MNKEGFGNKLLEALKRAIDILIIVSGLILLWPIFGLIALAIRLDSKGPVVYRHKRIGKDGIPFDLYKFRSMISNGDDSGYMQYLEQLIKSERDGDGKALPYLKLTSDPRITRVGRFLRTYYLDELPQVFNILKGDMSLVGPRPHVQFEVDHYTEEQRRRLSAKPGATGLWQVSGKADCSFSELIKLDLDYIDNWSLWLDFQIIFKTVALMLRGGENFWTRLTEHIPAKSPLSLTKSDTSQIGPAAGNSPR